MCLVQEIERMEEQKLKSKFPGAPGLVYDWWIRNSFKIWQQQSDSGSDCKGWIWCSVSTVDFLTGLGGRPGLGGAGGHSAFLQVNILQTYLQFCHVK